MQVGEIKRLVEHYNEEQLQAAELAIMEEATPQIEVNGKDEGEKLTHIMAAIEILKDVATTGGTVNEGMRRFSQRVRKSIS